MEVVKPVLRSVFAASPPQTFVDVLRHAHAALKATKSQVDPIYLIGSILDDLPADIRAPVKILIDNEDMFVILWENLENAAAEPQPKCRCFW